MKKWILFLCFPCFHNFILHSMDFLQLGILGIKKSEQVVKVAKEPNKLSHLVVENATYYMIHFLHLNGSIGSFKKFGTFSSKKDLEDEELIKYLNETMGKDGVSVIISFHDKDDKRVGNYDLYRKRICFPTIRTFNQYCETDPVMKDIFRLQESRLDPKTKYAPTVAMITPSKRFGKVALFYTNRGRCLKFICAFKVNGCESLTAPSLDDFKKNNQFQEIDLSKLVCITSFYSYEFRKDYAEELENFEDIGGKPEETQSCIIC